MSAPYIETFSHHSPLLIDGDNAYGIENASVDRISRSLFNDYFSAREIAAEAHGAVDERDLSDVHAGVDFWIEASGVIPVDKGFSKEEYSTPNRDAIEERFQQLTDYLLATYPDDVQEEDLELTKKFLDSTFAMYEDVPQDGEVTPDADGSFAFVVPARMSRENTEYGQEVEQVIPLLKYVPRNLRASMMVGLPPFVIDRYNVDQHGKRGYLVFAPMYPDMITDLGDAVLEVAEKKVNEAVDFAYSRLGTKVIGLGAILPAVTSFGRTIKNPNVITTTGHGGTVQLILETVRRAQREERLGDKELDAIGVIGLGSIGASIASVVHDSYPDVQMRLYDTRGPLTKKVAGNLGVPAAESVKEVIEASDVIISAVTSKIDLDELGLENDALRGKMIVDDSQPACFDPEQVASYGGSVAWVVGRDGDTIVRGSYSYGDTLADAKLDLFGCEAEAATISAKYQEYLANGMSSAEADAAARQIALRGPVTPEKVRPIAQLFMQYGVEAAPLQAFGKTI